MSAQMQADKVFFQSPSNVPANGRYPAKTQIKVSCGFDFWLSSSSIDLTKFPVMEACELEATIERVGGGKGFIVMEASAVTVKPVAGAKK